MHRLLIVLLLLSPTVWAASQVRITRPVTVYSRPDFESKVAFSLNAGTQIAVGDKPVNGFRKIRATVDGRKRIRYIPAADLDFQKDLGKRGPWGLGGGVFYSRFPQAAKSFSTSDDVTYTTSEYLSQTFNFAAFFEFGGKSFWRIYGGLRSVEFDAKATLNVVGGSEQAIEVGYRFLNIGGQKAWPLFTDWLYAGGGLEFAKSISAKAKIGNQDLSSKVEAPDYVEAFGMVGAQYAVQSQWSVFVELRLGAVANQSPTIGVIEVVSSVLYWPK